jgi:hypothetical protein
MITLLILDRLHNRFRIEQFPERMSYRPLSASDRRKEERGLFPFGTFGMRKDRTKSFSSPL